MQNILALIKKLEKENQKKSRPRPVEVVDTTFDDEFDLDLVEPAAPQQDMVRVFDDDHKEMLITQDSWDKSIIPYNIQLHWDDPQALYSTVINELEVNNTNHPSFLQASERLLEIDDIPQRATSLRAIVLMKNERYQEAEQVCLDYCAKYGEDATVLVNLAKTYGYRNQLDLETETLRRAVDLDPNQENGLSFLLLVIKEENGHDQYMQELQHFASLDGAWYARYLLAEEIIDNDYQRAMGLLKEAISISSDLSQTLYYISGMLGNKGYLNEIVSLVFPRYLPDFHRQEVGYNLLTTFLNKPSKALGKALMESMENSNAVFDPEIMQQFREGFQSTDSEVK